MHSPSVTVAFPFAVCFVSSIATKLIHLYIHVSAAPFIAFLFFLPTLFLPDVFILSAARLLIRGERGLLCLVGYLVGCFLTLVMLGAAASQLGFFYETGGELEWRDAGSFAQSEEGREVLLSGSFSVVASGVVLLATAWFAKNPLYRTVGEFVVGVGQIATAAYRRIQHACRDEDDEHDDIETDAGDDSDSESDSEPDSESEDGLSENHTFLAEAEKRFLRPAKHFTDAIPPWTMTSILLIWLGMAALFRPHKPYHHMSTALPLSLLAAFKSTPNYCAEQQTLTENIWPFPELLNSTHWEDPNGYFKGWAPDFDSELASAYRNRTVDWLPDPAPRGFWRWDPHRSAKSLIDSVSAPDSKTESDDSENGDVKQNCEGVKLSDSFYNPVNDPLRITNLDTDILQPVKEALDDGSVKIKHVVFILMESLREELFPIQQGSDIHRIIMESNNEDDRDEINGRVSHMTPNIEKITGKPGGFKDHNGSNYPADEEVEWDDQTKPGFGGINVVGGFSPSSISTKSIAASHCGVWPMAVEMFEEAETESYQPCIPQILELFNQLKINESSDDFREQKWHPAFYQAVTDTYDRQNMFDRKMGFDETIARTQLREKTKDNPAVKEINYFGFAENVLRSYIKDYVKDAAANNERMFLTHFTSITHHPWKTPDWFESATYMGSNGVKRHKDFDKYLNTIRYHDSWMGELMQLFDDLEIANETLVVFAGDHGQAFKEDDGKQGTYENAHISNFRIPITFRHPHLPRYQYEANATTVSVLPTILDLLIHSGSLNPNDTNIASDIIQDYEGQSLIRPYKTSQDGRRAWNFGIVNSGGAMLTVTSADAPWRLVMPLEDDVSWKLTDLKNDPLELEPVDKWSKGRFIPEVEGRFGEEAAKWAEEAESVAKWWSTERKRLWRYHTA